MDRRPKGRAESQGSLPPITARRSMFPPSSPHPNGRVGGGGAGGGGGGGGGGVMTTSPFATPGTEAWRNQSRNGGGTNFQNHHQQLEQQNQHQAASKGVAHDFEKGPIE